MTAAEQVQRLVPVRLRVNALDEPLGVGTPSPELSWRLEGPAGASQVGFELEVLGPDDHPVWTVSVPQSSQQRVRYDGRPLDSVTSYRWRIRAHDPDEGPGEWSNWAHFETGILDEQLWTARWVGSPQDEPGRPISLRGRVEVPQGTVKARAYASALGWYQLCVGGHDVAEASLLPGFTSFDHEVEYQTYDITELVTGPSLLLDVTVADGRFRGALGMHNRRETYGDRLGAIVQLMFEDAAGARTWVGSDATWRADTGQVTAADPKFGETLDLTVPAAFAEDDGSPVTLLPSHRRRLVAESAPRLRHVETLSATVESRPGGRHLVDFGQNFAGIIRIRVSGLAGRVVTLQHSEDIRADGTLEWQHLDREGAKDKTRPQRFQRDEIVLDGEARWIQPCFTIHGFRYVEISGLDSLASSDVEGIVLSSDPHPTGQFDSSNTLLNQLWRNAYWSLRSNFLDTPTDCPTRERGGFTGDAMVFAPAATALSDVQAYLRRYLARLAVDQFDDGRVPMIVPGEFSEFSGGPTPRDLQVSSAVGWGDATALLPWTLYERYGDVQVLRDQYPSMKAWVEYLHRGGASKGFIWGEWVRPGESTMRGLMRDNTINRKNVGFAYLVHSARTLTRIAAVLGEDDDERHYSEVASKALTTWRRVAMKRGGRVGVGRQDDYVRALAFDLLPEDKQPAAVERLVGLIEKAGDHLATGFLSTPLLLETLTQFGRSDVAYRLLLQTTPPSWLGMVQAGATTITEHWSEPGKDGNRYGSSNHYALGSVVEWFTSGIAGIVPVEPGYRRVRIAPTPGGGLRHASASVDTPYGVVSVSWEVTSYGGRARVSLPVGVSGEFVHSDGSSSELTSGTYNLQL